MKGCVSLAEKWAESLFRVLTKPLTHRIPSVPSPCSKGAWRRGIDPEGSWGGDYIKGPPLQPVSAGPIATQQERTVVVGQALIQVSLLPDDLFTFASELFIPLAQAPSVGQPWQDRPPKETLQRLCECRGNPSRVLMAHPIFFSRNIQLQCHEGHL